MSDARRHKLDWWHRALSLPDACIACRELHSRAAHIRWTMQCDKRGENYTHREELVSKRVPSGCHLQLT